MSRRLSVALLFVGYSAFGLPATASVPYTYVAIDSPPGELIGRGRSRQIGHTGEPFDAQAAFGGAGTTATYLRLIFSSGRVGQSAPDNLVLYFAAPHGAPLHVGSFSAASASTALWNDFLASDVPLLNVVADGSSCTGTGSFVVHEITRSRSNAHSVLTFSAEFEQRCAGSTATLRGSVRFNRAIGPRRDVDLDARDDLVWQNSQSGAITGWHITPSGLLGSIVFTPSAPNTPDWRLSAIALGTTRTQFIWRREDGWLASWLMEVNSFEGKVQSFAEFPLLPAAVPEWEVVATGDLDGQPPQEVIARNLADGRVAVWFFREAYGLSYPDVLVQESILPIAVPNRDWQVAGVADLGGPQGSGPDGLGDIIWYNRGTGVVTAWAMDGQNYLGAVLLDAPRVSDLGWKLAAVLDVDVDGVPDFVWHHAQLGHLAWWKMDGKTFQGAFVLPWPAVTDPAWSIVGG